MTKIELYGFALRVEVRIKYNHKVEPILYGKHFAHAKLNTTTQCFEVCLLDTDDPEDAAKEFASIAGLRSDDDGIAHPREAVLKHYHSFDHANAFIKALIKAFRLTGISTQDLSMTG